MGITHLRCLSDFFRGVKWFCETCVPPPPGTPFSQVIEKREACVLEEDFYVDRPIRAELVDVRNVQQPCDTLDSDGDLDCEGAEIFETIRSYCDWL
ncbi:hypothetical protein NPIL_436411 [Nephila pilipes]|uniref:Uncharacterized protein n=1 Tax=Nephila pilipes TaxID=299642 RepID=A0A8X6TXK7_NEPPI|nr:hypothetical protein NPIL_436411 [Nephila pilipes]